MQCTGQSKNTLHTEKGLFVSKGEMIGKDFPSRVPSGKCEALLRYCFEEKKRTGITFPESQYFVALTRQQHDDFDDWRDAYHSMNMRRYVHCQFNLALKTWLKECAEDQWRDVAAFVDQDGWVKLTSRESLSYSDWRMGKWSMFEREMEES